jgi:hypothetical protein
LNFGDDDEADLVAQIQKLRTELVQAFARNDIMEKEQKLLKIHLGSNKAGNHPAIHDADIPQLHKDHKL